MLNPGNDRVDYGEKLRPPEGYQLSYALATTYTLELDTLLCLPLALSFDNALDNAVPGEKLVLLEGINQLKGRINVFYQQGNIKVPNTFNQLYTLMEPYLVPVVPDQPFSSFHPKIWLLRFINENKDVRYRLIVLSRNLTFDRSWDLAVTLEGTISGNESQENEGLLALIRELSPQSRDFSTAFKLFKKELPAVTWHKPAGFSGLKTLSGGKTQVPLEFGKNTDGVLVISPFLHIDALKMLAERGKQHWLFSRADELERIGEDNLEDWDCFALNDRLISGEDELEKAQGQNLHAKLVLLQNGRTAHWHIGSANATKAALGGGNQSFPRNTEFMLRLSGSASDLSVDQLRTELVGTADKPTGIFIPYEFGSHRPDEPSVNEQAHRGLLHALISEKWLITATCGALETYTCTVLCPDALRGLGDTIHVQWMATSHSQPLQDAMVWENLKLTQISAFLILKIQLAGGGLEQLVVKADLEIEGGDRREQQITASLIDSPHKLLSYIRMILQPDLQKAEWLGAETNAFCSGDIGAALSEILDGPLYESLLRCASRQPDKLERIDALLTHLTTIEGRIPEAFSNIWIHYRAFLGKKKS